MDHEILAKSLAFSYSRGIDVELVKDASELPTEGEDKVYVAAVKGGLRFRIFDDKGKTAFDIQLITSVVDETQPRIAPKSLIIANYFDSVACFRIFDADGMGIFLPNGIDIVNTAKDGQQQHSGLIEDLRRELEQRPSTRNLGVSEKERIITAVESLANPSVLEKIKSLQKTCEKLWPPNDPERSEKRKIIERVAEITGLASSLKPRFEPVKGFSTGLAKETIYRLNDVQKTLDEIDSGWLRCGPKKPKHACYVGHASFCGKTCYVWVCRDGLGGFSKFTRAVLKLGSTFKDVQVVTVPTGIQFSPALTNTPR